MALAHLFRPSTARPRRAAWGDATLAESPSTTLVDGREYFPPGTVEWDRLVPSDQTSVCPWKGVATYFDVVDGDRRLPAAAWSYQSPTRAAAAIAGHVAFWRGVDVGPAV
ncbi:MAG: DUF427 domain-containing protein [Actinomycetota bacterium]